MEPPLPLVIPSTLSQRGLRRIEPSLQPSVEASPIAQLGERRIETRLPLLAPTGTLPERGRDIKSDAQPIVEISIDEISIRATPPPPPATPRRERLVHPPMSLEDYLRRRSGSGSR